MATLATVQIRRPRIAHDTRATRKPSPITSTAAGEDRTPCGRENPRVPDQLQVLERRRSPIAALSYRALGSRSEAENTTSGDPSELVTARAGRTRGDHAHAPAGGETLPQRWGEVRSERITAVWALRNPDKLTRWGGRYSRSLRLKKRTFSGLLSAGVA
ncbi:hypothetical protein GCM10009805_31130 [Leucobacter chromiireducens subsp. solipictus]